MIFAKKYFFFLISCFLHHFVQAQEMVNLVLVNSKTLEPVPFASLYIFNSRIGNYSDENGRCSLPLHTTDTVYITSIGFTSKKIVLHSTAIDSIFLDPYVDQLETVTVSQRIPIGNAIFGITQSKVDLRWGPSGRSSEEYAQLITIAAKEDVIVKVKKVILHAEYFNPTTPVLLHIYSVNGKTGLPDKDILQTKYLITAKNFKRKKVVVDLDAENLYLMDKKIFVGFEWLGKAMTNISSTGTPTLLHMTKSFPGWVTYKKYVQNNEYTWHVWKLNLPNEKDNKPVNTIFSIEVEQYK